MSFNPKISAADKALYGSNAGDSSTGDQAYGRLLLVSAKPCEVFDVGVNNERSGTAFYYLLIVDKATAPADGDLPVYCAKRIYDGTTDGVSFPAGLRLKLGLGVCISTTPHQVTLPSVSDAVFHVTYRH